MELGNFPYNAAARGLSSLDPHLSMPGVSKIMPGTEVRYPECIEALME